MRQHEFTVDLPHSAPRLWALFQRYDLWKEYAPAVLDVEVVYPGDAAGNGLLRRVVYPLPFGRRGESFELVKNVRANQGYDYVMLRTELSGSMTLEPLGPNRTRLRFREQEHGARAGASAHAPPHTAPSIDLAAASAYLASVRCTACGTELIAGKKFCHACGARAALSCRGCGATVSPDFRFCPDCGLEIGSAGVHDAPPPATDDPLARLSRHIPEGLADKIRSAQTIAGERKQVTVLFCDLAGSTAIAERLDPEEYHDLLDEYLELAFREIYRVEGIVNQIAGDGLMALFGAPVAHEDAPQRALRAALAIDEALGRLNERLRGRGLELRARIGIHTGPVVVGTVGNDLKMDYTAIGDTTNLAARLESLAAPGTILASEATYRLVRGFFQVRPTGPLVVKGKSEPVAAYEILGESAAATPMAIAAERGLTPLVGRDEELAQLQACFRRLEGSQAQVVAVVGDAGLGKSRLLYEFRRRLEGEPVIFFEGRCSALAAPYFPFINMLKHYFGLVRGDTADAACAKIAAKVGDHSAERVEREYPALGRLLGMRAGTAGESAQRSEEHSLNSSHVEISYAVFCLKKKKQ